MGQPGSNIFATSTVLDFNRVLARPALADACACHLALAHLETDSLLHSFVVMPHHVHFLSKLGPRVDASKLLQRFKSSSGFHLGRELTDSERDGFSMQMGLNGRAFWKVGFRSVVVEDEVPFGQKIDYIHLNPVRAGLAENALAYRWSSCWILNALQLGPEGTLDLTWLIRQFGGASSLDS